jgi:hypothetical protein
MVSGDLKGRQFTLLLIALKRYYKYVSDIADDFNERLL